MTDSEVPERLEKLERENRGLKVVGIAAMLGIAGILLIAAARPVPEKITVHEFDVLESSGKVGISITGRVVNILDPQSGLPRIAIGDVTPSTVGIWIFEGHGAKRVSLPGTGEAAFSLFDTQGKPRMAMGITEGEPSMQLSDSHGFEMDLGGTSKLVPTSGTTEHTSAASITMFGNDEKHHVMWSAP